MLDRLSTAVRGEAQAIKAKRGIASTTPKAFSKYCCILAAMQCFHTHSENDIYLLQCRTYQGHLKHLNAAPEQQLASIASVALSSTSRVYIPPWLKNTTHAESEHEMLEKSMQHADVNACNVGEFVCEEMVRLFVYVHMKVLAADNNPCLWFLCCAICTLGCGARIHRQIEKQTRLLKLVDKSGLGGLHCDDENSRDRSRWLCGAFVLLLMHIRQRASPAAEGAPQAATAKPLKLAGRASVKLKTLAQGSILLM